MEAEQPVRERLIEYFGGCEWDSVLDTVGCDKRSVYPRYIGPALETYPDGSFESIVSGGPRMKMIDTPFGLIGAYVFFPWADIEKPGQLKDRWGWNGKIEWWDFTSVTKQIDELEERGSYWISSHGDPSGLQHLCMWAGDENYLYILASDEELAVAMIEKHNEIRLEHAMRTLEAGGGRIHQLDGGGDYGTQRGMLIHPGTFRRLFKPLYQKFYREIKANYDVKIQFHSCGSIVDIIPDLIEVGVDILDPVQVQAHGMSPEELHSRFSDSLIFHGGVDIQELLPHASPMEVAAEIKRLYCALGGGSGYIIAPTHFIQADTPLENILAMCGEVRNLRQALEGDYRKNGE